MRVEREEGYFEEASRWGSALAAPELHLKIIPMQPRSNRGQRLIP